MIYFPYNEEMCSYTDTWMGELYENEYPLVSKGYGQEWSIWKLINFWIRSPNMAVCICKPRYVIVGPISYLESSEYIPWKVVGCYSIAKIPVYKT